MLPPPALLDSVSSLLGSDDEFVASLPEPHEHSPVVDPAPVMVLLQLTSRGPYPELNEMEYIWSSQIFHYLQQTQPTEAT